MRFSITEVENAEGEVTEYIAVDAEGEFDPTSFDTREEAQDEVDAMAAAVSHGR